MTHAPLTTVDMLVVDYEHDRAVALVADLRARLRAALPGEHERLERELADAEDVEGQLEVQLRRMIRRELASVYLGKEVEDRGPRS